MSGRRNFDARLRRLEAAVEGRGSLQDEIRESVLDWIGLALRVSYSKRDKKGEELEEFERSLIAAYEAAPGTPGWEPEVPEPGWSGPLDLDARKVEACIPTWVEECGWPDKPIDITEVVASEEYRRLAQMTDSDEPSRARDEQE